MARKIIAHTYPAGVFWAPHRFIYFPWVTGPKRPKADKPHSALRDAGIQIKASKSYEEWLGEQEDEQDLESELEQELTPLKYTEASENAPDLNVERRRVLVIEKKARGRPRGSLDGNPRKVRG